MTREQNKILSLTSSQLRQVLSLYGKFFRAISHTQRIAYASLTQHQVEPAKRE